MSGGKIKITFECDGRSIREMCNFKYFTNLAMIGIALFTLGPLIEVLGRSFNIIGWIFLLCYTLFGVITDMYDFPYVKHFLFMRSYVGRAIYFALHLLLIINVYSYNDPRAWGIAVIIMDGVAIISHTVAALCLCQRPVALCGTSASVLSEVLIAHSAQTSGNVAKKPPTQDESEVVLEADEEVVRKRNVNTEENKE